MNSNKSDMNLAERTFNSATLMIIASVVKQSIGLVSMVVLARLLSPTDYGIVAISMLVIHFFDVLAQTGTTQYVLCLLYTSPSPRDKRQSRMPSSA